MIGFLCLAILAGAAFAALRRLGVPRAWWTMPAAALMLGAAGYAWQGRPGVPGAPAQGRPPAPVVIEPELIALREQLLGRFTLDAAYLTAADAMTRAGDRRAAAWAMLGGVRKLPRSIAMWTGLGTAIAARDGDQVSPPALLAFNRAAQLAPRHPAPPFYLGLAYARAGDLDRAARLWRHAVALSPEGAPYRRTIARLLFALEAQRATAGRRN